MKFTDDDFPAENSSIYYDKIDLDIVWKRPAVSVNTESYRLFGRCVSYGDTLRRHTVVQSFYMGRSDI